MDKLTKEQRRKNTQAVKSHGSKIEFALSKELWKRVDTDTEKTTRQFLENLT